MTKSGSVLELLMTFKHLRKTSAIFPQIPRHAVAAARDGRGAAAQRREAGACGGGVHAGRSTEIIK